MRRAEHIAEARDRVAQARALGVQLVEARLQLRCHLVERASEQRELVPSLHRHTLFQVAAGDCTRSLDEAADRADDGPALDVGNDRDEDQRREQTEQETPFRVPVRSVDRGLRAHHAERRRRLFLQRSGDEHAVTRAVDRHRPRATRRDAHRPTKAARAGNDSSILDQHDVVGLIEAGARLESPDERRVERDGSDHRAARAGRSHDRDLPRGGHRDAAADPEPTAGDDREVRPVSKQSFERRSVAGNEGPLEGRIAGERRRGAAGILQLFLISGERRAQPGLKARVDGPRLRPSRNRREAPEGSRQRQQREQHEVGDEFELETTHGFPSSDRPPLPITPLEGLSAEQGSSMRVCARVLAAALMAGAIGAALAFPVRFGPGGEQHRALTAPPSSQLRTLHVPAWPAPRHHAALVVTHHAVWNAPRAEPSLVAARPVSSPRSHQPRRRPPTTVTQPQPPATVTRQLAAAPPAAAPVAAPAPAPAAPVRHGHGHAYGHDKHHGKPDPAAPAPAVAPAATPPAAEPADTQPPDSGAGPGPDHGNGHANGHDK